MIKPQLLTLDIRLSDLIAISDTTTEEFARSQPAALLSIIKFLIVKFYIYCYNLIGIIILKRSNWDLCSRFVFNLVKLCSVN